MHTAFYPRQQEERKEIEMEDSQMMHSHETQVARLHHHRINPTESGINIEDSIPFHYSMRVLRKQ
jgi:hypothetical protein